MMSLTGISINRPRCYLAYDEEFGGSLDEDVQGISFSGSWGFWQNGTTPWNAWFLPNIPKLTPDLKLDPKIDGMTCVCCEVFLFGRKEMGWDEMGWKVEDEKWDGSQMRESFHQPQVIQASASNVAVTHDALPLFENSLPFFEANAFTYNEQYSNIWELRV